MIVWDTLVLKLKIYVGSREHYHPVLRGYAMPCGYRLNRATSSDGRTLSRRKSQTYAARLPKISKALCLKHKLIFLSQYMFHCLSNLLDKLKCQLNFWLILRLGKINSQNTRPLHGVKSTHLKQHLRFLLELW